MSIRTADRSQEMPRLGVRLNRLKGICPERLASPFLERVAIGHNWLPYDELCGRDHAKQNRRF